MSTTAQAVHVLRHARKLIAEKGWTQGRFWEMESWRSPQTAYSLAGALFAVTPTISPTRTKAVELLGLKNHVEKWNDAPGRTKEEVLARLDEAIARGEAEIKQTP